MYLYMSGCCVYVVPLWLLCIVQNFFHYCSMKVVRLFLSNSPQPSRRHWTVLHRSEPFLICQNSLSGAFSNDSCFFIWIRCAHDLSCFSLYLHVPECFSGIFLYFVYLCHFVCHVTFIVRTFVAISFRNITLWQCPLSSVFLRTSKHHKVISPFLYTSYILSKSSSEEGHLCLPRKPWPGSM